MTATEPDGPPSTVVSESDRWAKDYQDFRHGRMARVQTAAQQWLGTITALLGLFGAATVVAGRTTVAALPPWEQLATFIGAILVYFLAGAAVLEGARATFGGLGLKPDGPSPVAPRTRWGRFKGILKKWWKPEALTGQLVDYIRTYEEKTDELRTHLHRSRLLGIAAAAMSGFLGCILLLFEVIAPKH